MNSIIQELILSWKMLISFSVAIVIVAGIQAIIALGIASNTVRATDVDCTVKSIDAKGNYLVAVFDCNGVEKSTSDAEFIAAYLKRPKPFTCTLYNGIGSAVCKLQGS